MTRTTHQPHDIIRSFFQALMQNQCQVCWQMFSDKTQKEFINWTLQDLHAQNPKAVEAAKLGPPEIKLMFENNNLDLLIRFWRRFVQQSRAFEIGRYAYYSTIEQNSKTATVEAQLKYDNGQERRLNFILVKERGGWKMDYFQSGLPF